jgi:hypothetical protein
MHQPRIEDGCRKLGELPGASDRDKVELWTRDLGDGAAALELVECSWGSGVGWYVQKRIRLDAAQVDALMALLAAGRDRLPRRRAPRPEVVHEEGAIRLLFSP